MKKYIIAAALSVSVFSVAGTASANHELMQHLSDQQKECFEQHDCPKWNKEEAKDSADNKAAKECKKKAFADCGIKMPDKKNGMKKAAADDNWDM